MNADQKPIRVVKFGAEIRVSEEMAFDARAAFDPRYERRHTWAEQPATPEAWERYRAAVAGLAAFEAYEGSQYGGPDYGNEVPPPGPLRTIDYLETHDEWIARCRKLQADAREPEAYCDHGPFDACRCLAQRQIVDIPSRDELIADLTRPKTGGQR